MSVRGPRYEMMRGNAYFTPRRCARQLVDELPPLPRRMEFWEPAAGAGHIASVLAAAYPGRVLATDLTAAPHPEFPVQSGLDFLTSSGPSGGGPLAFITNPPYGPQSRLALAFLHHALQLTETRAGLVALLLPFEFDARKSRIGLVSRHPAFAFKLTLTERIRWLNLPQKEAGPMGHHAFYVWCWNIRLLAAMRAGGMLRAV